PAPWPAACALGQRGETVKYVALVHGGTPAGKLVVTTGDDGLSTAEFVFKDNGRGPELTETYTLGADGTYKTYAVKGTSTFGGPVEESFTLQGGHATWKSLSDSGEKTVAGRGLYSPLSSTPAALQVALKAAAASGGEVALLPQGTLRVRKVAEHKIDGPAGARTVALMAMTGTGLSPTFVWATDAAAPRLFAFIVPGFLQLVQDGSQESADALEARQKAAEGEALADVGKRRIHRLPGAALVL